MSRFSRSFKALWAGEVISEFGGAAAAIINGLILFELTGSREWMGALWLVYFLPSLLLQGISAPFLNYVAKETVLRRVQLVRACAYIVPFLGLLSGVDALAITGLIALQCVLGLLAPIYASLSFSLLPEICEEKVLVEANGVLDGTLRVMSVLAPGVTALLLMVMPMHGVYILSAMLFVLSYVALANIPTTGPKLKPNWSKRFWFSEMKDGVTAFVRTPQLLRLALLSSTVQFAVGATMVLSIPFIRMELDGAQWEYALFAAAFPAGYVLGTILLAYIPKTDVMMYIGFVCGGLSFVLLFFVQSVPLAWGCELFGGIAFPLFNAQSAALFQRLAPRDRLAQISAVRLLIFRATMPLGILFASWTSLGLTTRSTYAVAGSIIVLPGIYYLAKAFYQQGKGGKGHRGGQNSNEQPKHNVI